MKDKPAYLLLLTAFCLLEAMKGLEPLSFGLQDRRSDSRLSYIARRISDFEFRIADLLIADSQSAIRNPKSEFPFGGPGRDSNPHVQFAGLPCCQLHHPP